MVPLFMLGLTAHAQNIYTAAGTGTAGYSGDGGAATGAMLNQPFGVAADAKGNLYIADRNNNRIRKIDASGTITTVAGNGTGGYGGDGAAATGAMINNITGVAVDKNGILYIADKSNNRIRKVDTFGIITTIAGTGAAAYDGDCGAATAAAINNPRGVAVDTLGNVYIADQANDRVRKIDTAGIITTFAGTGTLGYSGDGNAATAAELRNPYNIAADRKGNVYISDVDNACIRLVNSVGTISTVAGTGSIGSGGDGGPATAATFNEPIGIAVDTAGSLYIADGWNGRIRYVNAEGIINTAAGNGTSGFSGDGGWALSAELSNPYGVCVSNSGTIYIADNGNNRIRETRVPLAVVNPQPTESITVYPNPTSGPITINAAGIKLQQFTITTETGQVLRTFLSPKADLDLNLPPGIYLYKLDGKGIEATGKLEVR